MDLEPKIEPGSPSTNHVNLDRLDDGADMMETLDLEGMTIPSLVHVLLGACRTETFDRVGGVLVSRDLGLKQEIQLLQEKLEMERLSRLQLEDDFKKREEIVEKGKKLQESHEALLKEVKMGDLQNNKETVQVLRKTNIEMKQNYEAKLKEDKVTIEDIRKKNIELESEVNKLKEKRVEDGNGLDILRKKNAELASELKEKRVEEANVVILLRKENARLEHELLELNKDGNELEVLRKKNGELDNEVLKLKVRRVEDGNAFDVIKRKNYELEAKVLELEKLNEKWLNDSNALDELRGKVEVLEDENNALVGIEIKNNELKEKVKKNLATICELKCENRNLEDEKRKVEILLKSLNTEFRGLDDRNASLEGVNELRNDIVDEAGPLEVKGASSGMGILHTSFLYAHQCSMHTAVVCSSEAQRSVEILQKFWGGILIMRSTSLALCVHQHLETKSNKSRQIDKLHKKA